MTRRTTTEILSTRETSVHLRKENDSFAGDCDYPGSKALAGARCARRRVPDGCPRCVDRERRAAVDPEEPPLFDIGPGVGGQRIRTDVRRLPAARRAFGRPAWPAPRVHGRARALLALFTPLRPLHLTGSADRHARAAGHGGGPSVPVRLLDRVGHLRRG